MSHKVLRKAKTHAKNILTSSITGPNKRANKKLEAQHYLENCNHFMVSMLLAGIIGAHSFVGASSILQADAAANISHYTTHRIIAKKLLQKKTVSGEVRSLTGSEVPVFASAPTKQPIQKRVTVSGERK